jgi:hypothetical protein
MICFCQSSVCVVKNAATTFHDLRVWGCKPCTCLLHFTILNKLLKLCNLDGDSILMITNVYLDHFKDIYLESLGKTTQNCQYWTPQEVYSSSLKLEEQHYNCFYIILGGYKLNSLCVDQFL